MAIPQTLSLSLSNKTALITGSSSGIGAEIGRELSSRGAIVVLNYPSAPFRAEAEAVLESLATPGGIIVEADLSTLTGPQILVDAAAQHSGNGIIDIIVNNAGVAVNLPLESHTLEHWDAMVNLNARATFLVVQAALPYLPKPPSAGSSSGRIVNICSVSARAPPPNQTVYAGTKGMIDAFTRCWARELPPKYFGCTVNAVSPGPTRTGGFGAAGDNDNNNNNENENNNKSSFNQMSILQAAIDQTPVAPRVAEPSEIAYAVAFLCEERARWINGEHLLVDGGLFID